MWIVRVGRSAASAVSPDRLNWPLLLKTLAIGGAGGWLFQRLGMPLPWMLGSMTAVTAAVMAQVRLGAPAAVRPPMVAVIGVLLGSGFRPDLIRQLPEWGASLLGLAAFTIVSGGLCVLYLRRVAGYAPATAYFAGMPGGLVEMIEQAEKVGADVRAVALSHAARILLIVFTMPFIVGLIEGVSVADRPGPGLPLADAPLAGVGWLIGCALAGAWVGERLKLPATYLLGPMLVSAAAHLSGLSDFEPPREVVQGAQLVLGAVLGCRFVGTAPSAILRALTVAVGMTMVLLGATAVFAVLLAGLTGLPATTLMLAYSPGGLAEMSLVALALGAEVAFVAAHHVARVVMVMIGAGPVFALLGHQHPPPGPADD
ncbi:MAG: AbrB family transcriptional regulator [Rubrimonas sp.]